MQAYRERRRRQQARQRMTIIATGALLVLLIIVVLRTTQQGPAQIQEAQPLASKLTATAEPQLSVEAGGGQTPAVPTARVITPAGLHSGPGRDHPTIQHVAENTIVSLQAWYDASNGRWFQVALNGREAWMSEHVLEVDPGVLATLPTVSVPTATAPLTDSTNSGDNGLGSSRSAMQKALEQIGYAFEQREPIDGVPLVVGSSTSAGISIELHGPPEALAGVTIQAVDGFDAAQQEQRDAALLQCLQVIIPGWEPDLAWLATAKTRARETHEPQLLELPGNRVLTLAPGPHMLLITLTAH